MSYSPRHPGAGGLFSFCLYQPATLKVTAVVASQAPGGRQSEGGERNGKKTNEKCCR